MVAGFGKYDVHAVAGSIYCYPESSVLKNRFGLRDPAKLKALEADISAIRQNGLLENSICGHFSSNHLCRIHQYPFGDIYPFAGHFRREDIIKGTTRFLTHSEIKAKLIALLLTLCRESHLRGLSSQQFIERSAYYFAELNYIHPFRE
ncbi:MAG: Fic family protein [Oscillibacter sp.]|nr:Fic family protein [Oscillibacter sp.]